MYMYIKYDHTIYSPYDNIVIDAVYSKPWPHTAKEESENSR